MLHKYWNRYWLSVDNYRHTHSTFGALTQTKQVIRSFIPGYQSERGSEVTCQPGPGCVQWGWHLPTGRSPQCSRRSCGERNIWKCHRTQRSSQKQSKVLQNVDVHVERLFILCIALNNFRNIFVRLKIDLWTDHNLGKNVNSELFGRSNNFWIALRHAV